MVYLVYIDKISGWNSLIYPLLPAGFGVSDPPICSGIATAFPALVPCIHGAEAGIHLKQQLL